MSRPAEDSGNPAPEVLGLMRDGVRQQTLILLRWLAISGQTASILIAWGLFELDINLLLCLLVVGLAVIANLLSTFVFPKQVRLSDREAALTLLFDCTQLALLLSLTGGLTNPFSLLLLAPATVAATALGVGASVFVGVAAITLLTVIAAVHTPLALRDGTLVTLPPLLEFGHWLAIVVGVIFLGFYARRVAREIRVMGEALLATQMALAREQKLTDLGGVVAAAAHELGTPLATIKLASSELADELSDRPDLKADADLIRDQADRCRDILRSMGQAGKDDLHLRAAPASAVVQEAAEPHAGRGKALHFSRDAAAGLAEPTILRKPEIIHGLRNLVQNAVDFSASDVWIATEWNAEAISFRIADNGPGFPVHMIGRQGDPFLPRRREHDGGRRPHYDGMGLGLFIAKTLLERTGARLTFANGTDPFLTEDEHPEQSGAVVTVTWRRESIASPAGGPLGENRPLLR